MCIWAYMTWAVWNFVGAYLHVCHCALKFACAPVSIVWGQIALLARPNRVVRSGGSYFFVRVYPRVWETLLSVRRAIRKLKTRCRRPARALVPSRDHTIVSYYTLYICQRPPSTSTSTSSPLTSLTKVVILTPKYTRGWGGQKFHTCSAIFRICYAPIFSCSHVHRIRQCSVCLKSQCCVFSSFVFANEMLNGVNFLPRYSRPYCQTFVISLRNFQCSGNAKLKLRHAKFHISTLKKTTMHCSLSSSHTTCQHLRPI